MTTGQLSVALLGLTLAAGFSVRANELSSIEANAFPVALSQAASPAELAAAKVLTERLGQHTGPMRGLGQDGGVLQVAVRLAVVGRDPAHDALCEAQGLKLPGREKPFAEGYAVKSILIDGVPAILALGVRPETPDPYVFH